MSLSLARIALTSLPAMSLPRSWIPSSISWICWPRPRAAQPRWVSKIWPTFIRDGTPSGLRTMSTGVPSSRNGMSSLGRMRLMTPLLPWRPAILSPGCSLRFTATNTLTILSTPGGSSSPRSSFSTRSSKRLTMTLIASSYCAFRASMSAWRLSSLTAIFHHSWRSMPSSIASSMVLPFLTPLGAGGGDLLQQHRPRDARRWRG